ncbi:hypothetical protein BVY00_02590 [bacterium G20]|nr:hypothetical protein BVY00_02590 [bacterium G20]
MFKLSKKLAAAGAGLMVVAMTALSPSPVFADSPGQLTGGPNVYLVKNLTQGGSYANSVSAACNEEVQYSTQLHNAAFGGLTNIQVSANLAGGTISAVPAEGASAGTTGNVTVNVASGGTLAYENGTTVLYDVSGNALKTLPDTITSGGVNVGNLSGSTTEFVNFRAIVNCPITPTTFSSTQTATATATASANATCPPSQSGDSVTVSADGSATATASATSNVSQADADQKAHDAAMQAATPSAQSNAQANANAKAQASVKCSSAVVTVVKSPPTKVLPNTGPGEMVAGLFAGTSVLGTAGHYLVTRRRR